MPTTGLYNSGANEAMRHQKMHQAKGADATAQLASGKTANKASVKPSDQALASQMESLNKVIDQAAINAKNLSSVIQLGSKTLLNMKNTLATMDALAAQAQAGEIGDKERAQIHAVMSKLREGMQTAASETEFNGTKLFTGGAGTVTTAAAIAMAGTNGTSATHANSFAAGANAATQGYVSGVAQSATVSNNGTNAFDFEVVIGDQTFKATSVTPTANGVLKLVSTTNSENIFAMTFAADVTDIDTTAELAQLQTALTEALKLQPGASPAVINSLATAANGGFTSVSAATTAAPGEYAVTYAANSNTLKVQDAEGNSFSQTVTAPGVAQAVTFDNGLTVNLAAGFALNTAITQVIVEVGAGTSVSMSSQTGAYSNNTTTIAFSGAQTSQLGSAGLKLDSISLLTKDSAALASVAIKEAMDQISTMYGNLGAAMGNLELKQTVLADTSNELQNAISGIADADIPKAITEQKIAEVMAELANIAQGKALQQSQQLLKLAQQA